MSLMCRVWIHRHVHPVIQFPVCKLFLFFRVYRWGQFGFMTRGVIFGMIGYMTLKTGISARMNGFKTKPEVLEKFQMQFGSWLFFVLAIGMLGYAVFMFVKARYIALYLD